MTNRPVKKWMNYLFYYAAMFLEGCSFCMNHTSARELENMTVWEFCQDLTPENSEIVIPENAEWTQLSIPHVFRLSGLNENSAGWYRRHFKAEKNDNMQLYLFLEGAGSVADVFLNQQYIGQH